MATSDALVVTGLNKEKERLTGFGNLVRDRKVNGEQTIAFSVFPTEFNEFAFDMVTEESMITLDGDNYIVKNVKEIAIGDTYYKQVEAVHDFYDYMTNRYIYKTYTGSMTFYAALDFIFGATHYEPRIIDNFKAKQWENFGDDTRLALLKRVLDRYGAEIELDGNFVIFRERVGSRTDFQFRYNFNIKTFQREIDTTSLSTYIQGYGKDGIRATYQSPNHDIFGRMHAPPVRDERFTSEETLLEELKRRIQDTPLISLTLDFVDLRSAGYPWIFPHEGDYVQLIYEPMDINIETRIVEIEEVFDANLDIVETKVTLANYKRDYAGTLFETVRKSMGRIVNTDGKIKYDVLDEAIKIATEALQSAQTELEFNNGIIARDKKDPNRVVVFNSAGLGISKDGGQTFRTAITGSGINADLITVGSLAANMIRAGEFVGNTIRTSGRNDNYLHMQNQQLRFWNDALEKMRLGFYWSKLDQEHNPQILMGAGFGTDGDLDQFRILKRPNMARLAYRRPDGQDIWMSFQGETDRPYVTLNQPLAVDTLYRDKTYFGKYPNINFVHAQEGVVRWHRTENSYISQTDGGKVAFVMNGVAVHSFDPSGEKVGGSIELDGEFFGMSPIDSPQVLIEYIEFDISLKEGGVEVYIDDKFLKSVDYKYAVFPNNGEVTEKGSNYFVLKGSGVCDCRIVGRRINRDNTFWAKPSEFDDADIIESEENKG